MDEGPENGRIGSPEAEGLADVRAEESHHHALNRQLGGWEQVGIAWIFRMEKGLAALDEEALQRGLAIDEGGDDVARARLTRGEKDDIVLDDIGADHGVAPDLEGEELRIGADPERRGVDGNMRVGLLIVGGGETGGDDTVERNAEETAATARVVRGVEETAGFTLETTERAFLDEGVDVALDGEGAGETEMSLNLAQHGRDAMLLLVFLDKIEYFLLA